jgi:hypothetical protein
MAIARYQETIPEYRVKVEALKSAVFVESRIAKYEELLLTMSSYSGRETQRFSEPE